MLMDAVLSRLQTLVEEAQQQMQAASTEDGLKGLEKQYLGRKGRLQDFMQMMRELEPSDRPSFGQRLNEVRSRIETLVQDMTDTLKARRLEADLARRRVDLSLPGRRPELGTQHPIRRVAKQIEDIFLDMGFEIAHGPQAEWDYFNFTALNFPDDHPARDMQDTLMLDNGALLRTHTSPVQVRTLLSYRPPIRIIAPGRVYRRDDDVTHSPVFHQVEGLQVDRKLSMANLKGVLERFAQSFFGKHTQIRLRPSFFPFTEPSVEVDIECIFCQQAGCRLCKQSGWIEILGAGMVDPNVLIEAGLDPEEWQAWAFGIGVERVAMLLYGISDIRLLFESDLRFLRQMGC